MMAVALTFNHWVSDGDPADKFLARMAELIRNSLSYCSNIGAE
jgi:pyruvate/2-oxoglutarate dehydrogenase complex dihydrolipoamide acyltransferase (E2) component